MGGKPEKAANFFERANSLEEEKEISDREEEIVNKIKFHEVFFCCSCMKFIFAIEKKLHHPTCENRIDVNKLTEKEK